MPDTIDVNERSRTYQFASGNEITYEDVIAVRRWPDIHEIFLGDGRRVVITGQYDAIEVEARD